MAAGAVALVALALAATPWAGAWSTLFDWFAPAWPLAPLGAVAALLLARGRGLAAVVAVVALAACLPTILAMPRAGGAGEGFRLRIVTHNVWVDNRDPGGTATDLERSGADIVLLQEVDGRFAGQLPRLRRAFPYANPCRTRCSLAILSRFPLERVRYRFRDAAGQQVGPGLLQTRVHLPGGAIVPLATIHLPRGAAPDVDAARRASLASAVELADRRALILAGDFNLVPWSARLLWLDRALAPLARATAAFSFPARVGRHAFPVPLAPIDHLYAGPAWRIAAVRRLPRTGSDHYAIAVDLIWHGPKAMVIGPNNRRGTP